MPELPEVETTCRGITGAATKQRITNVVIRNRQLRWPVEAHLETTLKNQRIHEVTRRAKYILLRTTKGTVILHLGMSGCLRVVKKDEPLKKHDHVDLVLTENIIRFNDPRRFGCLLYTEDPISEHKLFSSLGPEPLSSDFNGKYLHGYAKRSRTSIKTFIMKQSVVVGVGNIYASEALFLAKINPKRLCNQISQPRLEQLVIAIKQVLGQAISAGGTTLKDFYGSDGKPGYFSQRLKVYNRADEQCFSCSQEIKKITLGQRSTYYCTQCQT